MKRLLIAHFILLFIASFSVFSFVYQEPVCANSISCAKNLSSVVENDSPGTFLGMNIPVPDIDLSKDTSKEVVLGEHDTTAIKHIYVDLETQKLYAFENDQLFFQTLVSTGKWGRTPPGIYRIWVKIRSTRMSGGSGSDAYNLPNVPYVMFFFNDAVSKDRGYSLHGAYWHNNFGYPMSHGCVNMRQIDAEKIYNWVNPVTQQTTTYESKEDPGTQITICSKIQLNEGSLPVCVE